MRYELQGRTALVTGAARGIGAALARELGRRGGRVALVGIEPERLAEVSRTVPGSEWFEADVTDRAAVESAVAAAADSFGGIDVVVANAGVAPLGTVETFDPDAFERVVDVNLFGVYRGVRSALPHLIERRGYALCVASIAAFFHAPLMAHYAASKAAVEAFANSLRTEVGHVGVDVGTAYFGYIDTDLVRDGMRDPTAATLRSQTPQLFRRDYPPEAAAAAVADGIERRSRVIVFPRWIRPLLAARGLLQPLLDARVRRIGAADAIKAANERGRQREPAGP